MCVLLAIEAVSGFLVSCEGAAFDVGFNDS